MSASRTRVHSIGVYGGTFDPLHVGHLIIAETARAQLGLSRVLFIPAASAPHKRGRRATPARHRYQMLKLGLRGSATFAAADLELRRGGLSYTIDTLRELGAKNPGAQLWLIVGSDNLRDLFHWREPLEILKRCRIAVYKRPGYPIPASIVRRTRAVTLKGGMLDISATVIRRLEARAGSIRFLVPGPVERYIHRHRLYRRTARRSVP